MTVRLVRAFAVEVVLGATQAQSVQELQKPFVEGVAALNVGGVASAFDGVPNLRCCGLRSGTMRGRNGAIGTSQE